MDRGEQVADVALLQEVRKKLEKRYHDSTEVFPDFTQIRQIEVWPTRSSIINAVTGIGGMPRGRVTEIFGPFSSGKSTIACELVATLQRMDPNAVAMYVDYEHAFDAAYAHSLGVDLGANRFVFVQPEYLEQGASIVDAFVDENLVDLIILDSAAAMTPRAELEGDMDAEGGTQKGLQAALMSRFLSVATKKIARGRKPALVILNQTRAVIDIGGQKKKNAPKSQSAAGNAIKFYSSMRLELEIVYHEGDEGRGAKVGTDQVYTQNRVRVTAMKNKLAPPFIRGTFVIEYGKGTNNIVSIAELAESRLAIMSGAGFFKYQGDTPATTFSCRGREAFLELLKNTPELLKELEIKVTDAMKADHAKALGITSIRTEGKAKEITSAVQGPLVLRTQQSREEEPEDSRGVEPPVQLMAPGLPTTEI